MRVVVLLLALVACSRDDGPPSARPAPRPSPPVPASLPSTIARADYIGPAACGECHPAQLALWQTSLHRRMNQRASDPGAVIGDWNATIAYRGGTATFARDATAGYTMTLAKAGRSIRYRVTRTIGVRGLQEYVGIADGRTEEVRLPFGWWPRRASSSSGWSAQPDFDPWLDEATFDAYAEVVAPWAERCPWCHSTYPFAQRVARASARPVGHGLEQYFTSAPGPDRLAVDEQITPGISCESCHLGGRAHANGAPIHLVPAGAAARPGAPVATAFRDELKDPTIVNATCAQCHSGPSPTLPNGAALRNSAEALDVAAGPCTTMRCLDCHDPHTGATSDARAIAACTHCHATLAEPAVARAHAGPHQAATCLDCHMPRFVLGVDRFVRSHRISSPTDRVLLAAAAPNACNLCHLDKSIAWTLASLAEHFDVHLATVDTSRYANTVGETWLAAEPTIRLIAIAAYGRDAPSPPASSPAYVRAWSELLRYKSK